MKKPIDVAQGETVPHETLMAWVTLRSTSKLVKYLAPLVQGGLAREGFVWLAMETSHGHAMPIGSWIQEPKINRRMAARTKKLTRLERLPPELWAEITELGRARISVLKIVERIAQTRGILLSFEAAQRWAKKATVESPAFRSLRRLKRDEG